MLWLTKTWKTIVQNTVTDDGPGLTGLRILVHSPRVNYGEGTINAKYITVW